MQNDLINGRTPEDIKTGLRIHATWGQCKTCPYETEEEVEHGDCIDRLTKDVYALIERLESERDAALAKVPKWISVEERLPEKRGTYLCNYEFEESGRIVMSCDYLGSERWSFMQSSITHWMPLPEPPKEDA